MEARGGLGMRPECLRAADAWLGLRGDNLRSAAWELGVVAKYADVMTRDQILRHLDNAIAALKKARIYGKLAIHELEACRDA